MLTTMSKPKRTRTDAQIAAEAAYAATHEVIQVNVKFKSKEDLKMFKKLRERFPETLRTTVRENVKLAECPSMGEPITSYAPASSGAEDYRALAIEIMQQEGSHANAANS